MSDGISLSVVVAAVNTAETLRPWLDAIRPQAAGRQMEILLAAASDDRAAAVDPADACVRIVRGEAGALVPSLWGAALLQARGAIVAMTITACRPDSAWLDAIVAAHRDTPADGIGGVIDCEATARLSDRALHLVRYTPYLPPVAAAAVAEIAGDNGTYTGAALAAWRDVIARDGFWESEFNRDIRARGGALRIEPRIRVTHTRSYSFAGFTRQRFRHGRIFGRARRPQMTPSRRLARALLAPTVPVIMLARTLRTVAARGRLDARAALAVPLALWFFCCWAAGEAAGLLFG